MPVAERSRSPGNRSLVTTMVAFQTAVRGRGVGKNRSAKIRSICIICVQKNLTTKNWNTDDTDRTDLHRWTFITTVFQTAEQVNLRMPFLQRFRSSGAMRSPQQIAAAGVFLTAARGR